MNLEYDAYFFTGYSCIDSYLFTYVFISTYALFNDAVDISDYKTTIGGVISK
jgi:hypothetical protein